MAQVGHGIKGYKRLDVVEIFYEKKTEKM